MWKAKGVGVEPPRVFLKTTRFILATSVTSALFHIRTALEKQEEADILESKEKMFVICRQ